MHQFHSWSHLEISADLLKMLMTFFHVSPSFLTYLFTFGLKATTDDNPFFGSYTRRMFLPVAERERSEKDCYGKTPLRELGTCSEIDWRPAEFYYTVRHFEEHGRPELQDPWSLRQMAVYQRYYFSVKRSVWIMIQPFQSCQSKLWNDSYRFFRISDDDMAIPNPMSLHVQILCLTTSNWQWYFDTVRRKLSQFVSSSQTYYLRIWRLTAEFLPRRMRRPPTRLCPPKSLTTRSILKTANACKHSLTSF